MFCRHCGKKLPEGAKFCDGCGKPVAGAPQASPSGAIKKKRSTATVAIVLVSVLVVTAFLGVLVTGGFLLLSRSGKQPGQEPSTPVETQPQVLEEDAAVEEDPSLPAGVEPKTRPQLLNFSSIAAGAQPTASVPSYQVEPGLANVDNVRQFYLSEEQLYLLEKNLFVVSRGYQNEFFERYEENRYSQIPNFVTVDSMMHTYHLYFSLLLNRTEKNHLAGVLMDLSNEMLKASLEQYEVLTGTEWEEACLRNIAYFSVAVQLQDPTFTPPSEVAALVAQEVERINSAAGIDGSELALDNIDYSQFKPRGYYEGDERLERYFRAMMWYGQVNFSQVEDSLNRSALLMTLAMEQGNLTEWERIYTVTSCFAGVSDDLGYYEYAPAIESAYGGLPDVTDLPGNEAAYQEFAILASQMQPPAINSVPVMEGTENIAELKKGFRFMGQRFTIDAAVMQQLIYSNVDENAEGGRRMLPDALDVPAALGSDLALELLSEQGATEYAGYSENMQALRQAIAAAPDSSWSSSLYSSWLYTLAPLLEPKGEGYPSFMTSEEWQKKALETYAGSFTELKHDTVLYAKQAMAEMGGGPEEVIDDRGYVEPEVEVYRRFQLLAQQTADGLAGYGFLSDEDEENLSRLSELAGKLMTISEKELKNETLTDEEYDLIREYGGTLEHFWTEAVKDKSESDYLDAKEIPASLVTDVATDPNGTVLQIATGQPAEILVVVPIDGQLRLASGAVFSFYQFEQPLDQRLTDAEWRRMTGEWMDENGNYNWDAKVDKPWWTESYWSQP